MDKVIAAWTQAYHRRMQNKLRKEWPALARALDAAAQEATHSAPCNVVGRDKNPAVQGNQLTYIGEK